MANVIENIAIKNADAQALLLALTIAVALLFDSPTASRYGECYWDGGRDAGHAARVAVAFSAFSTLLALSTTQFPRGGGEHGWQSVAPAGGVALSMLVAVLFGAITWNLITLSAGLPSSSSHALIGALIGMGLVAYGLEAIQWAEVYPVFIALLTSPIAGLVIAYIFAVMLLNLLRKARPSQANGASQAPVIL